MYIRDYQPADLQQVLALTCETFQPFFEQSLPEMVTDAELAAHQHGQWREDYARELPALLGPDSRGHGLLAVDGDRLLGHLIWRPGERPDHAHIEILAVTPSVRRQGVARALMTRAFDDIRADGRGFVELGTGGDWFHAPARRLYEELGFHAIPVVAYLRRL